MVALVCLAAAALACHDRLSTAAVVQPPARSPSGVILGTGDGCIRLDATLNWTSRTATFTPDTTLACEGDIVPRVDSTGTIGASGAGDTVTVWVSLESTTAWQLGPPAALHIRGDSIVSLDPQGPNSWVSLSGADSSAAALSIWRYDTLLAPTGQQQILMPLQHSRSRAVVFVLNAQGDQFRVTLRASAAMLPWPETSTGRSAETLLDSAHLFQAVHGTDTTTVYRDVAVLHFETGVSDDAKSQLLLRRGLTVLGVTQDSAFYVRTPSLADLDALWALLASLRAEIEVELATPVLRGALRPVHSGVTPNDGPGMTRADFDSLSGSTWALRAIRAPLAWGCETGGYGATRVRIGILEQKFHPAHPQLDHVARNWMPDSSKVSGRRPVDSVWIDTTSLVHSVKTTGVLAAKGNDSAGVAGVLWRSALYQYASISSENRPLSMLDELSQILEQVRADDVRVLSVSADGKLPMGVIPVTAQHDLLVSRSRAAIRELKNTPNLLVVIATGNDGTRMLSTTYLSTPGARAVLATMLIARGDPDLRDRIIFVEGSAANGAYWTASNHFTDITDIAAPAAGVRVLGKWTGQTGAATPVTVDSGTSLAAPAVAGVAGMILAMDPLLSPASVKNVILAGAQVPFRDPATGLWKSTVQRALTGAPDVIYQLDAYESLKLAAASTAAPLCGNRIWVSDLGELLAQRGGADQLLGTITAPGDFLYTPHGGRRVLFSAQDDDGLHAFDHGTGGVWTKYPDAWELEDDWNGTVYGLFQAFQMSHDRTNYVQVEWTSSTTTYDVMHGALSPSGYSLGEWKIGTVPRTTNDSGSVTIETYRRLGLSINGTDTTLANPANPYGSPWMREMAVVLDGSGPVWAYAPQGDIAYLGVTRRVNRLQHEAQWAPCDMSVGTFQGLPIEECRDWWYEPEVAGTDYYTIPLPMSAANHAATPLSWPSLVQPGVYLWSIFVSEDGGELSIAHGVEGQTPDHEDVTWSNCQLQWLSTNGGTVGRSMANAHACENPFVGITSLSRRRTVAGPNLSRTARAGQAGNGAIGSVWTPTLPSDFHSPVPRFRDYLAEVRSSQR